MTERLRAAIDAVLASASPYSSAWEFDKHPDGSWADGVALYIELESAYDEETPK